MASWWHHGAVVTVASFTQFGGAVFNMVDKVCALRG